MRNSRRTQGETQQQSDLDYLDQMRGGPVPPETQPAGATVVPGPVGGPGGLAVGVPAQVTGTGPARQGSPVGYAAPGEGQPYPPWTAAAPLPYAPPPPPSAPGQAPIFWGQAQAPTLSGPTSIAGAGSGKSELITCPECGEMAMVDPGHRLADDFCRKCDFPLFWARATVILPSGEETGASLRRLPGTVGRAATAFIPCPHCGEPNSPIAEICVRCALSMHPVAPPPPEPVYIPEPEPEPEPEPVEQRWPAWVLVLVMVIILVIIGLMALVAVS